MSEKQSNSKTQAIFTQIQELNDKMERVLYAFAELKQQGVQDREEMLKMVQEFLQKQEFLNVEISDSAKSDAASKPKKKAAAAPKPKAAPSAPAAGSVSAMTMPLFVAHLFTQEYARLEEIVSPTLLEQIMSQPKARAIYDKTKPNKREDLATKKKYAKVVYEELRDNHKHVLEQLRTVKENWAVVAEKSREPSPENDSAHASADDAKEEEDADSLLEE